LQDTSYSIELKHRSCCKRLFCAFCIRWPFA